jgi:hypothetical protein
MNQITNEIYTVIASILLLLAFLIAMFTPMYTVDWSQPQGSKVNSVEYVIHNIKSHNSNENRTV